MTSWNCPSHHQSFFSQHLCSGTDGLSVFVSFHLLKPLHLLPLQSSTAAACGAPPPIKSRLMKSPLKLTPHSNGLFPPVSTLYSTYTLKI